MFESAKSEHPG